MIFLALCLTFHAVAQESTSESTSDVPAKETSTQDAPPSETPAEPAPTPDPSETVSGNKEAAGKEGESPADAPPADAPPADTAPDAQGTASEESTTAGAPETEPSTPPAAEEESEDKEELGKVWGNLRWIASYASDFPVDAEGTTLGQHAWLDQRVRLGGSFKFGITEISTEWELGTPQLIGDTWGIPGSEDERRRDIRTLWVRPRQALVVSYLGNFQIQAGLTTSHWGLGMLANDGNQEHWFGRSDFGDRVVRLRATRLPYQPDGPAKRVSMFLTAAADLVVADEIGSLRNGQLAGQGILSALWETRSGNKWGAYAVLRHQRERDRSRSTTALATDVYADFHWDAGKWQIRAAAEAALIAGTTSRATTYNARNSQTVLQAGATGLVEITDKDDRFAIRLRSGYASGDANSDDGMTSDFIFDRDFAAGMVLFDQYTGSIEANTYHLINNPELTGKGPDGADALVTEGAFKRSIFLQPAISIRPISWATVRVGTTLTVAPLPLAHPYYTYRAGGSPRNHHNMPTDAGWMGTELNWAVQLHSLGSNTETSPTIALQAGHLLPGKALVATADQQWIHHVMGTVLVRW